MLTPARPGTFASSNGTVVSAPVVNVAAKANLLNALFRDCTTRLRHYVCSGTS
jgi:hypothetical protein